MNMQELVERTFGVKSHDEYKLISQKSSLNKKQKADRKVRNKMQRVSRRGQR
jgi:hypothetical protein